MHIGSLLLGFALGLLVSMLALGLALAALRHRDR